ncbi:histidine kinase 3 [Tanacetum coccineum]
MDNLDRAHDKKGTRADVSAPGWSANDWLAPEGTKILSADQSEADTSAHVFPYHVPIGHLFIYDNNVNLQVAEGVLKKYGAEVVCADGGRKAISLLKPPHSFDTCFMDIQMPEMDG